MKTSKDIDRKRTKLFGRYAAIKFFVALGVLLSLFVWHKSGIEYFVIANDGGVRQSVLWITIRLLQGKMTGEVFSIWKPFAMKQNEIFQFFNFKIFQYLRNVEKLSENRLEKYNPK